MSRCASVCFTVSRCVLHFFWICLNKFVYTYVFEQIGLDTYVFRCVFLCLAVSLCVSMCLHAFGTSLTSVETNLSRQTCLDKFV
jgi:hypothetical protein